MSVDVDKLRQVSAAELARLAEMWQARRDGIFLSDDVPLYMEQRTSAILARAIGPLLDVYEAACAWRDVDQPDFDILNPEHEARLGAAVDSLKAEVDRARAP